MEKNDTTKSMSISPTVESQSNAVSEQPTKKPKPVYSEAALERLRANAAKARKRKLELAAERKNQNGQKEVQVKEGSSQGAQEGNVFGENRERQGVLQEKEGKEEKEVATSDWWSFFDNMTDWSK